MSTVLWIVGEPGIGKTTLARALIQRITGHTIRSDCGAIEIAKPKWTLFPTNPAGGVAAAGTWRGDKFDGADTLPISSIRPAMEYWSKHLTNYRLTILDGDKLSQPHALSTARNEGARVRCVCLDDSGDGIAAQRRAARGTEQNLTWVKGRRTKSLNFAKSLAVFERLYLSASVELIEQVDRVREFLGQL